MVTFHVCSKFHVTPFLLAYGGTGINCFKKRQDWSTTGHITFTIVATIPSPFSYQSMRHMLHIAQYSSTISHVPGGTAASVLLLSWPTRTNLTITTPSPCLPSQTGRHLLFTGPWWWGLSSDTRSLEDGQWETRCAHAVTGKVHGQGDHQHKAVHRHQHPDIA